MDIQRGWIINDFIEPNRKQYIIPVYQRNYEWSREQCVKLFEDIVLAYKKDKQHFCGSIVYAPFGEKNGIDYYIIVDGQQRLTTVYLLIKALMDCAKTEKEKESISESVFNVNKFNDYDIEEASKLKLKPIKTDNQQLYLLMENKYDQIDKSSGIWINYSIFKEEITALLQEDPDISVKDIYKGIEKLICAKIRLEATDNAQEIFERINSTGVPLSLSDQIRNYVLMTDENQEKLYEDYWLVIEQLVAKENMTAFFLDYLNLKKEGFTKEDQGYDSFKDLYKAERYDNESMLKELKHYAEYYNVFLNGSKDYSSEINEYLEGLRLLKQTTVYLFLFKVFDDYKENIIDQKELARVLRLLLNYSIRRIMCDISSNSLRGLYKTLYNRVFAQPENKSHYYDSIVSFLLQMTSKDAIPSDEDFAYALKNNNLYKKNALCRYLLIGIENQGKEKVLTDSLSIEHVMPQNKNLSAEWQKMLGDNWQADKDRWLHTLGNLTLTGYNSELGDRPFRIKKKLIEENQTKIVNLYEDIQDKEIWNADAIQDRADRLVKEVMKLYPIEQPAELVKFVDTRYAEYTVADPSNATYKTVNYYELEGERVLVDSFALMVRSVVKKLYEKDPSIIERMAKNLEMFSDWTSPVFSYDQNDIKGNTKIDGTNIYMSTGYSAQVCASFIRGLLKKYDLDIEEDFVYSARAHKPDQNDEDDETDSIEKRELRKQYWEYSLPIIQEENEENGMFSNCNATHRNSISGYFGIGGFFISCSANYDMTGIDLWLNSSDEEKNKEAFDILYSHREEIEKEIGDSLNWDRGEGYKAAWMTHHLKSKIVTNKDDWQDMAEYHSQMSRKVLDACYPYLAEKYKAGENSEKYALVSKIAQKIKEYVTEEKPEIKLGKSNRTFIRYQTDYMDSLLPDTPGLLSGWNTPNHYYYEFRNKDGKKLFMKLAFSSRNLTDEQREIIDKINLHYPSKGKDPNWQWRTPFVTDSYELDSNNLDQSIEEAIDNCFEEMKSFEEDLKVKLKQ